MKLGLIVPSLLLAGVVLGACSTGSDGDGSPASDALSSPRVETRIAFGTTTAFAKRACTVKLRWDGGGDVVKVAGDFTSPTWAGGAMPMTRQGGAHEITIGPGGGIDAGKLYAYKLVIDGSWRIDPTSPYRKIVDGQMNSAFVLPECEAGPETVSGKVSVTGAAANVRITVHTAADADRIADLRASLDNGAVPNGSYAEVPEAGAIDFKLAGLAKGKHTLSLRSFDTKGRESLPIDLPFWVEDEAFDYRDGVLYMMLIDRFANGDKQNDRPVGGPVHYDADWHGGDLEGALQVMKTGYFEKLGIRTIWLSPLNTQTNNYHVGDGNQLYSAYHGYWPVKSREVEPRFGGDAALKAFVAEAHKRGLRVLLDLINNQVHDDHEYVRSNPSWFRKNCKCGDDAAGCGWSQRPFDCLFQYYLPDIDWTQPGAEKQFVADAANWIAAFDLDGFRVDAVKHVEANSVYNMRAELARRFEQGGARIFMVGETAVGEFDRGQFFGETFANGYDWIDAYTGPAALDGQFDFPTRHNMADGLVNGDKPLVEVEEQLHKAETRYRPGNHHVRFLNGHDNPRIASIAAKDPKLGCLWSNGCRDGALPPLAYSDAEVYVKLKRALTVLYSMPGVPYLYMGDEVAFGGGSDPDMRRNMLFGEGLDGLQMSKPGTVPAALTDQQANLREWVRKLGGVRSASRAIRRGERRTLLAERDFWVYAYQTAPNEVAIVALNRGGETSRTIDASALDLGSITGWSNPLGVGDASSAGSNLTISLGRGEAAIFVTR